MKSKRLILCLLGLCGWFVAVQAQTVALKTDLVNWATASLNLEPEVKVGRKSTMALGLSWNPWTFSDNKKWRHLRVQPEYRYWICRPFGGHFLGLHAAFGKLCIMILTHAFTFSWNAPPCKRRIRFTREQSAICRCREKTQGCNLSRILHFSCGERPSSGPAIRPAPAPQRKSGKKYGRTPHFPLYLRYRSFSRISLSRFQLTASAAPLHHGRKNRSSRKRKGMLPYSPG